MKEYERNFSPGDKALIRETIRIVLLEEFPKILKIHELECNHGKKLMRIAWVMGALVLAGAHGSEIFRLLMNLF